MPEVKKMSRGEEVALIKEEKKKPPKGTSLIYKIIKWPLSAGLFLTAIWWLTMNDILGALTTDYTQYLTTSFAISYCFVLGSAILSDFISIVTSYYSTRRIYKKEGFIGKITLYDKLHEPSWWVYNLVYWLLDAFIWTIGITTVVINLVSEAIPSFEWIFIVFIVYLAQKIIISYLALKSVSIFLTPM